MSGRQAFDELTKDLTPERRARVDARKAELRAAMPLHEWYGRQPIVEPWVEKLIAQAPQWANRIYSSAVH